jgi:hypothetical protein
VRDEQEPRRLGEAQAGGEGGLDCGRRALGDAGEDVRPAATRELRAQRVGRVLAVGGRDRSDRAGRPRVRVPDGPAGMGPERQPGRAALERVVGAFAVPLEQTALLGRAELERRAVEAVPLVRVTDGVKKGPVHGLQVAERRRPEAQCAGR